MSFANFQRRLAAVERELGIDASRDDTNTDGSNDLIRRLDLLEQQIFAKLGLRSPTLTRLYCPAPLNWYQIKGAGPRLRRA